MERFQDVLDNAQCSTGSITLTFNKEVEFDQVQKAWGWVNSADKNYIVLVTENAQCNMPDGDPSSRQPWHIKHATFDDGKNTVTLSAEPKTWEDAFSHWHLRVSSKGIVPRGIHRSLVKRIGYNGTASLPLAFDFSSPTLSLGDTELHNSASIACSSCYTTGSLDFDIDVTYWFPASLTGTVTMTPNDIGASITTQISVDEGLSSGLYKTFTLFQFHPDSFYIAGIIDVGPSFYVNLIAGIDECTAKVELATGISMQIPADSVAVLDFNDASQNKWYDWVPQFTPQIPDNLFSEQISVSASVGAQIRVEFDAQVLGFGLSAGVALDAPTLELTVSGIAEDDACDSKGADFGVEFDVSLGAELDLFAGFVAATDLPNKLVLASTSYDIYSTCAPVASGTPTGASSAPIPTSSTAPYNSSYAVPSVSSTRIAYSSWPAESSSSSAYPAVSSSSVLDASSSYIAAAYSSSSAAPSFSSSDVFIASSSSSASAASSSVVEYVSSLSIEYFSYSSVIYYTSTIIEVVSASAAP